MIRRQHRVLGLLLGSLVLLSCHPVSGQNSVTLEGPSPFADLVDDDSLPQQKWRIVGDEFDFSLRDQSNFSTFFRVYPNPAFDAVTIDGAAIGFHRPFPSSPFEVGSLTDFSGLYWNPDTDGFPSLLVEEENQTATFKVSTLNEDKSALLLLDQGDVSFSFKSSSQGKFVMRDEVSKKNAITIFPNTLNNNVITIRNGNLGIKRGLPTKPLHMQNGAFCSTGGVWTNASSRKLKQNIAPLEAEVAVDAIRRIEPVTYRYKNSPAETHVGFIAEDVPEVVATNDRESLAAMDVVATLTRVVQIQQDELQRQRQDIEKLRTQLERRDAVLSVVLARLDMDTEALGTQPTIEPETEDNPVQPASVVAVR